MTFATRWYYRLKPYLPWSLRAGMRRLHARRVRKQNTNTWPILPASAHGKDNWNGWPNNKDFALVLTHDVECQVGYDLIPRLAAMEKERGFVASFNLIPEGPYRVEKALRQKLESDGFEIGVHDLHHDGFLYRSRDEFKRRAQRINQHLSDWGAVGFRSAYMHHHLEWIRDLNVLYDASTFDTDPFEPQPDGVGSIFPFPYPDAASSVMDGGYIELPYTLPQDASLFLYLGERDNTIWKRKLDWVAEQGGMALVNVHPDYMAFDDTFGRSTYPARFYSELLDYVASRYAGRYWHALPRDVAKFVQSASRKAANV